jgi:hypothetical protein
MNKNLEEKIAKVGEDVAELKHTVGARKTKEETLDNPVTHGEERISTLEDKDTDTVEKNGLIYLWRDSKHKKPKKNGRDEPMTDAECL